METGLQDATPWQFPPAKLAGGSETSMWICVTVISTQLTYNSVYFTLHTRFKILFFKFRELFPPPERLK